MAVETAPSPAPSTVKQQETITRLERATGVPKAQRKDATEMTRSQASDYISALIARTQADDEDEAPAPPTAPPARRLEPVLPADARPGAASGGVAETVAVSQPTATPQAGRVLPANQVGEREFAETRAAMQQLPGTRNETPQGEWPPVPAQSSEGVAYARSQSSTAEQPQARQKEILVPTIQPHQAQASDNPFDSDGDDDLDLRLGDGEDESDPELVRVLPAPVGGPFAFQITSADWMPPKSSQYGGIRLTCTGLPDGNEAGQTANGTEAGDYLSMSPASRWRHEALLAAIGEERCKRSQLPGHTFWATTEADDWEREDPDTGEKRVTKRTRIKDYLQGPTPPAPKANLNGAAPRAKAQATLGSEFDSEKKIDLNETPF